jgi:hypothetical protein
MPSRAASRGDEGIAAQLGSCGLASAGSPRLGAWLRDPKEMLLGAQISSRSIKGSTAVALPFLLL